MRVHLVRQSCDPAMERLHTQDTPCHTRAPDSYCVGIRSSIVVSPRSGFDLEPVYQPKLGIMWRMTLQGDLNRLADAILIGAVQNDADVIDRPQFLVKLFFRKCL
jgi:hypothetical protein